MVVGTNSMPIGIPSIWISVKKGTLLSANSDKAWLWKQHSCEAAPRPGGPGTRPLLAWQLCSQMVCLLCCTIRSVSALAKKHILWSSVESVLSEPERSSIICTEVPNPSLRLVKIEPLWLVGAVQFWLDIESLKLIRWNKIPGNRYNGWLRGPKHSADRQFSAEAGSLAQGLLCQE